jgi:hypothetical protein
VIERLSEKYGPPVSKWYDGGAWHAMWFGFNVTIRDEGGISLELIGVSPEMVDEILAVRQRVR